MHSLVPAVPHFRSSRFNLLRLIDGRIGDLTESISCRGPIAQHLFSSFDKNRECRSGVRVVVQAAPNRSSMFHCRAPAGSVFSVTRSLAETRASQDQANDLPAGSSIEPDRTGVQHFGAAPKTLRMGESVLPPGFHGELS